MKTVKRMRGNVVDPEQYEIHNLPCASVYRVAAQIVSTGVLFPVSMDTVEYDTDSMWSSAAPSVLTCRTAGLYRFTAWWTWDATGVGQRGLLLWRTLFNQPAVQTLYPGGGILAEGNEINATGGGLYTAHGPLSYDIVLNAGDFVTMRVSQFTGANLSIIPSTAPLRYNGFQACLISTI